ncbi:sigma-70 family RNA polymerase sigma factor [Quadrisphaera sp. KR29]|uniref:sigma-70 family RNA polymerase sigma factor n=1 Tax=Quadrisphaera sp. KR29 TaxID=3461391 RepID=UPI0040448A98
MELVETGAVGRAAGPRAVARRSAGAPRAGAAPGAAPAMRDDLEAVFRREYPLVAGVAARVLGGPQHADDVAQEVFLSFARSSPAAVPADRARGWLCVAATHTALNLLRSGRRRSAREDAAATGQAALTGDVVADVADEVVTGEERRRVRAALARLPRTQATALVLRHSGLSYGEVAAALHLSPTSVGTTVRRAESALREEMDR